MLNLRLPDVSEVDFSIADEINGFTAILCSARHNDGIAGLARNGIARIEKTMPNMPVSEALMAVTAYDILHRMAYKCAADRKTVNRYVFKAFDARIHGDSSVDEYVLYTEIKRGIEAGDARYFDKALLWNCISEERWYNDSLKDSSTQRAYDCMSRAAILLGNDLMPYAGNGEIAYKQTLATRERRHLDTLEAPDSLTLRAAEQFLDAARNYMPEIEYMHYLRKLERSLLDSKLTNRLYKAAGKITDKCTAE